MNIKKLGIILMSAVLIGGMTIAVGINREVAENYIQVNATERSKTFYFSSLEGTNLPTSTTYKTNINATTNPCGFIFTGSWNRSGTLPTYALGYNTGRSPIAIINIEKPTYVLIITKVRVAVWSASTTNRYIKISDVQNSTVITSNNSTESNPLIIEVAINSSSFYVEGTGALLFKNFEIFYT